METALWTSLGSAMSLKGLTNGVHEATIHVSVEQVGHGQDGAVTEGCQTTRHPSLATAHRLTLVLHLATVVQQVHEQREVPAHQHKQHM